jgi:reverse gyrase
MGKLIVVYENNLNNLSEDSKTSLFESGALSNSTINLLREILSNTEKEFYEFFTRVTCGLNPWGAQKAWIKRLLKGENTVLVAPTGVGKTTLLLVYALYSALHGKRVLYIVPTRSLGDQVFEKLSTMSSPIQKSIRIIYYNSSLQSKIRVSMLNSIINEDFNILIITSAFLRKLRTLYSRNLDVIIVDDADSLIKNERNIYILLQLLGYDQHDINLAKRRIELLRKILVDRVTGKDTTTLIKELIDIDVELERALKNKNLGQLVVASATSYIRSLAGKILRDLLKIDISGITIYGRDITDTYIYINNVSEVVTEVLKIIKKLGKGGIIYISPRNPGRDVFVEAAKKIQEILASSGFRVSEATPASISKLVSGELDFLVGFSSYYSISVRGIDSPHNIKYVIFLGTPVFSNPLEKFLTNPNTLVRVALEIAEQLRDRVLTQQVLKIRKSLLYASSMEKKLIRYCLLGKIPENMILDKSKIHELYISIKDLYIQLLPVVKGIIDLRGVLSIGIVTLIKSGGKYLAITPDLLTYIQASGRTSRLLGDKMTHGLSIIVEFSEYSNLVKSLDLKFKTLDKEMGLKPASEVDFDHEVLLLESSRIGDRGVNKLKYKSILLVVESPTKAKTIARFFGKPIVRRVGDISIYTIPVKIGDEILEFNIVSTRGHICDLTTKSNIGIFGVEVDGDSIRSVYTTIKRCKICGTQFTDLDMCPRCGSNIYTDSKVLIYLLQKIGLEVDEVYIATDPDIEGEKIAYDIYTIIKPFNDNIWRIKLHEITRSELLNALKEKKPVDLKLVEAEVYRRILDRLVGFSLSMKLQEAFKNKNMGIGRVQGPLLDFIVKRYYDHINNRCKKICVSTNIPLKFVFCTHIDNADLIEELKNASSVELIKLSEDTIEISPKPPYTTEDLLIDASNKLGLQAEVVMKTAQELYEAGLITYHRTDCTYVSNLGISIAKTYLQSKSMESLFTPKHWGEPGSHEAIRPVNSYDSEQLLRALEEGLLSLAIPLTSRHLMIYDLIFRRFIASQMKPYKAIRSKFKVVVSDIELGELNVLVDIVEHGFDLVDKPRLYKDLKGFEKLSLNINSIRVFNSSRVMLYSEGDLVSLMKNYGIGRPSTYSKIISSLKRHGYILLSKTRQKVVPTKKGIIVHKYLTENYSKCLSVELTRRMEDVVEAIHTGKLDIYDAVISILIDLVENGVLDYSILPTNLYSYISLHLSSYGLTSNQHTI